MQSTEYLVQLEGRPHDSVIQAQPSFGVGARVQMMESANRTTRLAAVWSAPRRKGLGPFRRPGRRGRGS